MKTTYNLKQTAKMVGLTAAAGLSLWAANTTIDCMFDVASNEPSYDFVVYQGRMPNASNTTYSTDLEAKTEAKK